MSPATPTHDGRADPPEYEGYVASLRAEDAALAEEIAGFTGIGAVLSWMARKGLDLKAIDPVTEDEFAYDFLLPLGADGRWLAFGVT